MNQGNISGMKKEAAIFAVKFIRSGIKEFGNKKGAMKNHCSFKNFILIGEK